MKGKKRPPLVGVYGKSDRYKAQYRAPKLHEKSTAKSLGGYTQKASGSKFDAKGDVAGVDGGRFDFHGECKTTQGRTLTLEAQWLNKITSEAEALFKIPFLAIRFRQRILDTLASELWRKLGKPVKTAEQDWIAIPRSVFVEMLDELEGRYGM
jgi:hypothetical protein